MSLRTRILLQIAAVSFVLIALVIVTASVVISDTITRAENAAMHRDLDRLELARTETLSSLAGVTRDYATWDDAYAFIASGDPGFVQSNLQDQTFRNLRVNVILFVDGSGQLVFGKAFDLERDAPIALAPELVAAFGPGRELLRRGGTGNDLSGLLLLDNDPLLLSAQPIVRSDGRGPSRGTVVMGRLQNAASIARLSEATQLNVRIHRLDGPLPAELQPVVAALSEGAIEVIRPVDDQVLAGYMVLEDVYGAPALLVQANTARTTFWIGRNALLWFISAFVLLAFASALLVVLAVERSALTPLARISRDVGRIGAAGDASRRISAPRAGLELDRLALSINNTLAALQNSRQALEVSEMRYRRLVEAAQDVTYTLQQDDDGQVRLTSVYGAFERSTGWSRDQWVGRPIAEIVHPDDVPMTAEMFQRVMKGEVPPAFPVRIATADGGYMVGEVICTPLVENGRIVGQQGAVRDISARYRLESLLEAVSFASERFLRAGRWQDEISVVLERLGTASQVSRVYLFEQVTLPDGTLAASLRYQWAAPGARPQQRPLPRQNVPVAGGYERWHEMLSAGEPVGGRVRDFPEAERGPLEQQGILSVMVKPIFAGGQYWGFIEFDDCQSERVWVEFEREALRTAAGAIGAAIRRSESDAERAQTQRRLLLMNEITRDALQAADLRAVARLLTDRLDDVLTADACAIALWDDLAHEVQVVVASLAWHRFAARDYPDERVRALAEQTLAAGSVTRFESKDASPALLGLPLAAGSQRLGAVLIAYNTPRRFSIVELAVAEQVAEHFSLVVARARLVEESRRRADELSSLRAIALDITAAQKLPVLLRTVLNRATRLLNSNGGGLYIRQPGQSHVSCVVSAGSDRDCTGLVLRFGVGAAGTVALSGEPLIVTDHTAWTQSGSAHVDDPAFSSLVGVPIKWEGAVTGVIIVGGREQRYTSADVDLLMLFAEQASIAIENTRLFAEVERLAVTDDVTGAFNRRYLIGAVEREVARARRFDHSVSLLMLDLDFFKAVNDQFGHQRGDLALRAFAERLRGNIREIDIAARYGGEEFVVVVPEADQLAARQAAERLRACIAATPLDAGGVPVEVTASIGVATLTPDDRDGASLLARADAALYGAKHSGRNRVVVA